MQGERVSVIINGAFESRAYLSGNKLTVWKGRYTFDGTITVNGKTRKILEVINPDEGALIAAEERINSLYKDYKSSNKRTQKERENLLVDIGITREALAGFGKFVILTLGD